MSAHRHDYIETEERARQILGRNPPQSRTAESFGLILLAQRRLRPVTTEEERRAVREYNAARGFVCKLWEPSEDDARDGDQHTMEPGP